MKVKIGECRKLEVEQGSDRWQRHEYCLQKTNQAKGAERQRDYKASDLEKKDIPLRFKIKHKAIWLQ